MDGDAGGGGGDGAEYDYNALLAKVDNSIEESHAAASAPVVVNIPQFPSKSSLFHYIKANHSFIRLYRTNVNVIDLPRSIYVLVASVFFQLLLCIEFSRAGLALGATWILSIVTWQPCLILITWSVTVNTLPFCWPYISLGGLLALAVWDLARGITYDDGANAVAAFLFVFISNFLAEFFTIAIRFYSCYASCGGAPEDPQKQRRSASAIQRRTDHLQAAGRRSLVSSPHDPSSAGGSAVLASSRGFVPPAVTTVPHQPQPGAGREDAT